MAVELRRVTGPIKAPDGEPVEIGYVSIGLLYPIVCSNDFVAPFKVEYPIQGGDLPVGAKIAVPGSYEFRVFDVVKECLWGFKVSVLVEDSSALSIAQLFMLSREQGISPILEELVRKEVDLVFLSSGAAPEGEVPIADGEGGIYWGYETIFVDRSSLKKYRLFVDDGQIKLEEV